MTFLITRGAKYEYTRTDTGKQYFSVSQTRSLMWDGFRHVPPQILEQAQIRGTRLHIRFGLCLGAQLDLCPYPKPIDGLEGYSESMDSFIQEYKPVPVKIEEPSCNDKLQLAGTPDALVTIGGVLTLPDLKSGDPTPTDGVQLLSYHLFDGYTDAVRLCDIYLDANGGKPEVKDVKKLQHQSHWAGFLNALNLLKWRASI